MEQVPQPPRMLTKNDVMRVATDLYGEHSQGASDINLILEEGEENPRVFSKRIKEARNKILRTMMLEDMGETLTAGERDVYLRRLGYSGSEALEEIRQMDEDLGIVENEIPPSKLN
jgi:hypothetical protein